MKLQKSHLEFQDGTKLEAKSFGFEGNTSGELVFYTAMTGYPESLTDPSYYGQILVATYPLIGNYGVPKDSFNDNLLEYYESNKIHCKGIIISDYSPKESHWNSKQSLGNWLKDQKIPGLCCIDTRELTKKLRDQGSALAKIVIDDQETEFYNPNSENIVDKVSTTEKIVYGNGKYRVLLVDCGVKTNIIRCLLSRDCTVVRVPWDFDFSKEDYDAILLSNGPGDPKYCEKTINNLRIAMKEDKPIFGICLGNQLLALAAGAKTYKLKYGHRSHNQGIINESTDKCYISSQNHGYAINRSSLPEDWDILFSNINDNTIEGIKHKTKPFFSVQFHPEACSGPTDTEYLFDDFIKLIKKCKADEKE